jgi:hypothetical protein
MPDNTVYVGRPTKWGNPWKIGDQLGHYPDGSPYLLDSREKIIREYRFYISQAKVQADLGGLDQIRGKNLACFCPLDKLCHADVLLELANR